VDLGCGVQQSCAACGSGETCYNATCCQALDCAAAADAGLVTGCNAVDLGCGVQKACAPCAAGTQCENDTCVQCQPKTCANYGDAGCNHSDGCTAQLLDCCAAGTVCMDGACCPPGQANQGGICCPAGEVNYQNSCCKPTCNPSLPDGPQSSCGEVIYCGAAP
jgi:hypothetical protein